MRTAAILVLLAGAACRMSDSAETARAVGAWHEGKGLPPLAHVEVRPVEGSSSLWVARCDTQADWWGFFGCYRVGAGGVAWEAVADEPPDEQSIHSVRGRECAVTGFPLVEVVGKTHMGNGFLSVFELRGRKLRRILHTRAYDSNDHDRLTFRGSVLDVDVHEDVDRRLLEIELSGVLEERSEEGDGSIIRSWPCRKVFRWDPVLDRFVEDASRRSGFSRYPELERQR